MFDISSFAQGLALGLGMFVCPGPKDLLILQRALSPHRALELVAIGVLSDALLIGLGMAGVSALLSHAPALQKAALWLGIGLMLAHGLLAARRAATGTGARASPNPATPPPSRRKDLAAVLAVSFLNPVAWLDTVLVIGTAGVQPCRHSCSPDSRAARSRPRWPGSAPWYLADAWQVAG